MFTNAVSMIIIGNIIEHLFALCINPYNSLWGVLYFIPKLHIQRPKLTEVKQCAQSPKADNKRELESNSVKLHNLPFPKTTTPAALIYLKIR